MKAIGLTTSPKIIVLFAFSLKYNPHSRYHPPSLFGTNILCSSGRFKCSRTCGSIRGIKGRLINCPFSRFLWLHKFTLSNREQMKRPWLVWNELEEKPFIFVSIPLCSFMLCFYKDGSQCVFPIRQGSSWTDRVVITNTLCVPLKQEFKTLNAGDFWITSGGSGSSPLNDPLLWRDLGGHQGVFRPTVSLVGNERLEFREFFPSRTFQRPWSADLRGVILPCMSLRMR